MDPFGNNLKTTTTSSGRPFDKYSFFLDPKNSTQINATLSEKIIQLGGVCLIFLFFFFDLFHV